MKKALRRILVLSLLLAYFVQGAAQIGQASITFDEGPHLAIGYATLRTGDFRLQPVHIHPPLANVLAASLLCLQDDLPDPREISGWEDASLSAVTDEVVWKYPYPARIATAGRFPILWLGVLLGALIFRWARDLSGSLAGLLALGLYAFDPNFIAHGALITTDMAAVLLSVATLYSLFRYLRGHAPGWLLVTGLLLGLAQLAKVSALMLIPVVGFLLFLDLLQRHGYNGSSVGHWMKPLLLRWCMVFLMAIFVIWAGYGFEIAPVPGFPFSLPAATHVRIYQSLREHYDLGHPTFLMGRTGAHGWWWYFLAAFGLKTPLPTLFLGLVMVAKWLFAWVKDPAAVVRKMVSQGVLLLFPILYAVSSLFSTVNIGYRHLLPMLPFLYIGVGCMLVSLFSSETSRRGGKAAALPRVLLKGCLILLLSWQATGTLWIGPHYLTFFNEVAGGPTNGYIYLVDSNLDWGQNLWDLKRWMEAWGKSDVYYAHYSPARPAVYDIKAAFLPPDPRATAFAPWNPDPGLYAIGATVLQGPYAPALNTYAWFRTRQPTAKLGNALFLYDVSSKDDIAWVAVCTSPIFSVSDDEVRTNFGDQDLRIIPFNCEQSWIYPGGGSSGRYLLPSELPITPGLVGPLDVRVRRSDGTISYEVHRSQNVEIALSSSESREPIASNAPLQFLNYTVDATFAYPDESVVLTTFWEVTQTPTQTFSIMAHLTTYEGFPIAVGDGFGISLDQLKPGDRLLQRHELKVPGETPPGAYPLQTGAYWLEGMERWLWQDSLDISADKIPLLEIEVGGVEQ